MKNMTLTDIPTVEELAETTGQTIEQLEKDRDAAAKMCPSEDAE